MEHMKVLVVREAPQAALPRRVSAPADAVGYTVYLVNKMLESDQVRAGPKICPVLVRAVDMAQPTEVPDLPLTPSVL